MYIIIETEKKYYKKTSLFIKSVSCNIKKENIISDGRVINIDKLVNKDFYNIIKNGFRQTYRIKFLENLLGNPGISK